MITSGDEQTDVSQPHGLIESRSSGVSDIFFPGHSSWFPTRGPSGANMSMVLRTPLLHRIVLAVSMRSRTLVTVPRRKAQSNKNAIKASDFRMEWTWLWHHPFSLFTWLDQDQA